MLSSARSVFNNQIQTYNSPPTAIRNIGVVMDVILNEDDVFIKNSNGENIAYIGGIKFRFLSDFASPSGDENYSLPFDKSITDLPTKNEVVEIYSISGVNYYKRFTISVFANINANTGLLDGLYSPVKTDEDKSRNYSQVASTGIESITLPNSQTNNTKFGNYFTAQPTIHKLKMYEGDWLVESRFGQSLRFSGYNNPTNEFSPTVILRNGESGVSQTRPITQTTEEDLNRDGSTFILSSNQYQFPFVPGSVSDTGQSDFNRAPIAFENYPTQLNGNQSLLTSGRLIFSSREAETMMFSKGNFGVVTDENFSVDSAGGIRLNIENNIDITTNDTDVNINTGGGGINLGNVELESLVKGETLVSLLSELIDTINKLQFLTPSGPTSVGPVNVPQFNNIKSKLNTMLSTLNKTS